MPSHKTMTIQQWIDLHARLPNRSSRRKICGYVSVVGIGAGHDGSLRKIKSGTADRVVHPAFGHPCVCQENK